MLQLANRLYGTHLLSASDAHTIDCTVGRGVTYVPIPPGTGENLAGLITVDLPTIVVAGQEFDVVVRRVASRRPPPIIEIGTAERPRLARASDDSDSEPQGPRADDEPPKADQGGVTGPVSEEELKAWEAAGAEEQTPAMRNWRYVVGTFQIKIPVSAGDALLRDEENTLAIMKWRLDHMATTTAGTRSSSATWGTCPRAWTASAETRAPSSPRPTAPPRAATQAASTRSPAASATWRLTASATSRASCCETAASAGPSGPASPPSATWSYEHAGSGCG